jgi:hypothetical protein
MIEENKIKARIEELTELRKKAEETHSKALQTLQQCERDMVALDAVITELSAFIKPKEE